MTEAQLETALLTICDSYMIHGDVSSKSTRNFIKVCLWNIKNY